MVLDATTGQNALVQAKEFDKTVDIDGIVLTKRWTAKGGMIFTIVMNGYSRSIYRTWEKVDDRKYLMQRNSFTN